MNAYAVLAEIIKAGPDLLLLGTIPGGTAKAPITTVLGHDLVDALLVSIEIIVSTEPVDLGASGNLAFEWFRMPKHMLPDLGLPKERVLRGPQFWPTFALTGSWR